MKTLLAIIAAIVALFIVFLARMEDKGRNEAIEREFSDRKKEHFIILSEIQGTKKAVEANGRKLDFLIEEYKRNSANRDFCGKANSHLQETRILTGRKK